ARRAGECGPARVPGPPARLGERGREPRTAGAQPARHYTRVLSQRGVIVKGACMVMRVGIVVCVGAIFTSACEIELSPHTPTAGEGVTFQNSGPPTEACPAWSCGTNSPSVDGTLSFHELSS